MTSRHEWSRRLALIAATSALALPGACGGSESEPEASRPAPPPRDTTPVDRPEPVRTASLTMAEGVEFPDDRAPSDRSLAQAVADLASALATGDSDAMASLLDPAGAAVLDDLEARGAWERSTASIERVRVTRVEPSAGTARVAIGVLDGPEAYLLGWEAMQQDGRWMFSGLAIEPQTALTLADLDGAALTVRMTPVARLEEEQAPVEAAPEESTRRQGGSRNRGLNR